MKFILIIFICFILLKLHEKITENKQKKRLFAEIQKLKFLN